jgi:Uma2 family endonuclease
MAISARPDITDDSAPSPWVGQRMTLEEFLALPEQKPALEYDAGVVTQKMAPTPDHIELQAILRAAFNATAEEQHLGRAFAEARFRTSDVAYVPDVGFYRRARLRTRPGHRYARDLGVPDIAVEIVSPDQSVTSLIRKCQRYLALGASIALIVDEDDEAILAFRPGQPLRVLQGDDRIDVDDVLPGLTLTISELFEAIVPRWVEEADTPAPDDTPTETSD